MKTFEEFKKTWRIDLGNGEYLDYSEGDLNLKNTQIKKLPENLKKITGNLDLYKSPIKELPENLKKITGNLDLSRTPIEKLPDNLTVNSDLYLYITSIKELPKGLKVGGRLNLNSTPLQHRVSEKDIREKCLIGGNIYPENLNGNEKKYQQWLLDQEAKKYNL